MLSGAWRFIRGPAPRSFLLGRSPRLFPSLHPATSRMSLAFLPKRHCKKLAVNYARPKTDPFRHFQACALPVVTARTFAFLCDGHHHPSIPRTFSSPPTEILGAFVVFNGQDRRCRRSRVPLLVSVPCPFALNPGAQSAQTRVRGRASSWPPPPGPQTPHPHFFKKATVSSPPPRSPVQPTGFKNPRRDLGGKFWNRSDKRRPLPFCWR